ncbi:hypothetical protein [Curtobacterium sp. L1-20]|uniref:hypothetical protein n=1 Tax=Curtobacterium sp. L1-20 TaxID=3138181 RepID=UPI003B5197CF
MKTVRTQKLTTQLAQEAIAGLRLPAGPLTFETLRASVADWLGKPVTIDPLQSLPSRDQPASLTGLYLDTAEAGRVYFHPDDPRLYQLFVILHEFMHIAAGHGGCHVPAEVLERGYAGVTAEVTAARARVPGRTSLNEARTVDVEELVAERGAVLLLERLQKSTLSASAEAFA